MLQNPRALGVVCAIVATLLGLVYMMAAGAPSLYLAVNALSMAMGLACIALIRPSGLTSRLSGGLVLMLGALLLATALSGVSAQGASRWIRVGGLSLQVSLIVLPLMMIAFTRARGILPALGMVLAAVALAVQPDRAMAGVLVLGLATLLVYRRDRWVVLPLAAASVGFTVALVRPDTLPAVPFVDQILYTSFEVHALAGLAVVGGALLLVVPAIAGLKLDPENRACHAVFGSVWLGVVGAAALGNYPTPLVGYGGSAILGYALSLSVLPGRVRSAAFLREPASEAAATDEGGPVELRVDLGDVKLATVHCPADARMFARPSMLNSSTFPRTRSLMPGWVTPNNFAARARVRFSALVTVRMLPMRMDRTPKRGPMGRVSRAQQAGSPPRPVPRTGRDEP